MDAEKPSFIVDLEKVMEPSKPVPSSIKTKRRDPFEYAKMLDYYPKFDEFFFDTVKECAVHIDELNDVNQKIFFSKRLSKLFVARDRTGLMRLFRDIVNARTHT